MIMAKFIKLSCFILSFLLTMNCFSQAKKRAAQTKVAQSAESQNIQLPNRPWHLMVIWWNLAEPVLDFNRYDIDITVDRDIPEDYNLYISPVGSALNGASFYGGLQTKN